MISDIFNLVTKEVLKYSSFAHLFLTGKIIEFSKKRRVLYIFATSNIRKLRS